ncbi:type I methionyl aminopeptidase [Sporocytophaga myxococcoides]|uniref:type I methionyl aminopeptidase n=1 Tax=Sporocytophaga myxococcoides TaxID=153721 RepID=UPI0003FE9B43|nr:type I methionyl aminopeptidase [Sporocytophaga myxococcoides]
MSISSQADIEGLQRISDAVALTLKQMREYAKPGMSTKELDEFGGEILRNFGARSAPKLTYGFPGWSCISLNDEIAHGIPSEKRILQEGDLINIDVSAELDGYWSDNGGSFVLGKDIHNHNPLVEASRSILYKAIHQVKGGVKIADIGLLIETEAKKAGFKVIKNLVGHGVGRSLHEAPEEIPCFNDKNNKQRFKKDSVVAIETFISTKATYAHDKGDGWTYITKDGSYVAQHEHTLIITDGKPIILTEANKIWD